MFSFESTCLQVCHCKRLLTLQHADPDRNLEQAEIKVKAGSYVHIINWLCAHYLLFCIDS